MKRYLTIVLLCLFLGAAASAQETGAPAFRKRFTIEVSSGPPIIHSVYASKRVLEDQLAKKGLQIESDGAVRPLVNVTGALLVHPRCELALTGGICWYLHRTIQYEEFGFDPQGNPRYNLNKSHPAGWRNSSPVGTVTFQARWIWNPGESCAIYSAAGAGILTNGARVELLPSITPVGVRLGGEHFFGFFETTIGSVATLFQAGLGWTF